MKDTQNRREEIVNLLKVSDKPLSGSFLAKKFDVSRQSIVQDIAILRAKGYKILSTNTGYYFKMQSVSRVFKTNHTSLETEDELNLIVDLGGIVDDVIVRHKTYGDIKVGLNVKSRRDVNKLIIDLKNKNAVHLKNLTNDYHYHTVIAESEEILDEIEDALYDRGYLIK